MHLKQKKLTFAGNTTELMVHERYHIQEFHSYCWEDSNTNVIKGKILTIKRKKTTRRKKPAKLITNHTFTKHQKLIQDTKIGCLVVFNTKKQFTFPKYKVPTDTKYNRDKAAKSVKKFLTSSEQSKDQREKVLDEEYNLSYLIQLPKGKHCYHNTGKAAGIAELLDPRVIDFVKS